MTVTKSTAVQVEEGQNRSRRCHALDQMTFVVRFAVRFGAKDGPVEEDVDGMVETVQGHNMTWRGIWRKIHGQ
jgi:hypothetical protein